jgi:MFS family permease
MLGVITPELARDLALGPSTLGTLSGTFFIAFALAQVPVGVLLDRVGPRRTASGLMLLGAAGAVILQILSGGIVAAASTPGGPAAAYRALFLFLALCLAAALAIYLYSTDRRG